MNRHLHTVDIEGTVFYVDALREELWQKDDPSNRISFNAFHETSDGYTLLYDRERKNAAEKDDALPLKDPRYQQITLPGLMELDPEGISLKYGIPLEVLSPGTKNADDLTLKKKDHEK